MHNPRTLLKNMYLGISNFYGISIQNFSSETNTIKIDKILVVSKLSRYEFERRKHRGMKDDELEKLLRKRGTNFEKLVHFHDLHKRFEENVVSTLKNMGVDVNVVNRFNCTRDRIATHDIILPVGGDGTFLLAASKVINNKTPVIGFNSDPNRSEGHLCLPKRYSTNIRAAIERLQTGNFEWLMRSRIRTTLVVSDEKHLIPTYLHEIECDNIDTHPQKEKGVKILPVLALNEVFIGESLSARVSHLQLRLNGSTEITRLKCSGMCVSTGTGSTSWHLSINRLPTQSVAELLRLISIETTEAEDGLAKRLSDTYNQNLMFSPDDQRMGYTIRDLISAGVWPQPKGIKSRGFSTKIEVKSNCFDACLVIDGGVAFTFNDGTIALLEIVPEDALRTVTLKD